MTMTTFCLYVIDENKVSHKYNVSSFSELAHEHDSTFRFKYFNENDGDFHYVEDSYTFTNALRYFGSIDKDVKLYTDSAKQRNAENLVSSAIVYSGVALILVAAFLGFVLLLCLATSSVPWSKAMIDAASDQKAAERIRISISAELMFCVFLLLFVFYIVVFMSIEIMLNYPKENQHQKRWLDNIQESIFCIFCVSILFLCLLILASKLHYQHADVENVFKTSYMNIPTMERFKFQNEFICCGRMYYNEPICDVDGKCLDSGILQNCVSEQVFDGGSKHQGGCVPHLVATFLSKSIFVSHYSILFVSLIFTSVISCFMCVLLYNAKLFSRMLAVA